MEHASINLTRKRVGRRPHSTASPRSCSPPAAANRAHPGYRSSTAQEYRSSGAPANVTSKTARLSIATMLLLATVASIAGYVITLFFGGQLVWPVPTTTTGAEPQISAPEPSLPSEVTLPRSGLVTDESDRLLPPMRQAAGWRASTRQNKNGPLLLCHLGSGLFCAATPARGSFSEKGHLGACSAAFPRRGDCDCPCPDLRMPAWDFLRVHRKIQSGSLWLP